MASLVKEPGVSPIGQFTVPTRGTWNSVAINNVPTDAVYLSNNVFIREGKLRERPGLFPFPGSSFTDPVVGGVMVVTPHDNMLLAVTRNTFYVRSEVDTAWTGSMPFPGDLTFVPDERTMVDIAFMETTGTAVAIIAAQGKPLKRWDAFSHDVSVIQPVPGSTATPLAKSVCIASRRVICLIPPHTLQWSRVFEVNNYNPLAYYKMAQTNDIGICVRSLSNLSFVLYKERSIYTARAQSGNDDTAFSFGEPLKVEGPASLHAVVDVGGSHVYMTANGRIALFDGSSYPQWIADGLWLYLQADIDPQFTSKIFGFYDFRLHCVIFYYPKRGYAGSLQGMVIVNMPMRSVDLQPAAPTLPYTFLGVCRKPCTFAYESRFNNIDRSLIFGGTLNDHTAYTLEEAYKYDDDIAFDCSIQTGLLPMPNGIHGYPSIETLVERQYGYGYMEVEPIISNSLEQRGGYVPDLKGKAINLEGTDILRSYDGFDVQCRFFGLRYNWSSLSTVRYSGTVVYARSTG